MFAAWTPDAALGVISGHRIVGRTAWYWAALARQGRPLLHITDFGITVRSDPFVVKGEALWAEHHCVDAMAQWSIGNETYASAIEDPDEALGRAYGDRTPIVFDLEWYATGEATQPAPTADRGGAEFGYEQVGVVHGSIEIHGETTVELIEAPGHRRHRWSTGVPAMHPDGGPDGGPIVDLGPLVLPEAVAHTGVRAPFAFPDGSTADLVLTPRGWARRARPRRARP